MCWDGQNAIKLNPNEFKVAAFHNTAQVDCWLTDAMLKRSQRNPVVHKTQKTRRPMSEGQILSMQTVCSCTEFTGSVWDVRQGCVYQSPTQRRPQSLKGAEKWSSNGFLEKKTALATSTQPPLTCLWILQLENQIMPRSSENIHIRVHHDMNHHGSYTVSRTVK